MKLRLSIAMLVVLAVPALVAAAAPPSAAQESDSSAQETVEDASYGRGFTIFHRYCRSCHGKEGEGDGHVAQYLKVAPTNLTRLTADNGGEFPTERVRESIDGREVSVPLHGRDMPIWGAVFQVDEGQTEADVQRKLSDLIAYIQGIQVETPDESDASAD